jgi:hypothetical protein
MDENNVLSEEEELEFTEADTQQLVTTSSYNNLQEYIENKLLFKGKSMSQWVETLVLPAIPDPLEREDILKLNQRSVFLCEVAYTNLAIAKAIHIGAKASYTKKVNLQKEAIREKIESATNKKPSDSVVENKAVNSCTADATTVTIAEFFYAFWQNQVDKVSAFNTRLTSLNISKHQEEKYLNNNFN